MDIDLTVLHIGIGAIVVEIKASANPLVEIGNPVTSLHKAEGLLRLFDESFPICKVAFSKTALNYYQNIRKENSSD